MNNYTLYQVGDCCVTMLVGPGINEAWNEKVLAMQRWLLAHRFTGLKDVITAYNSISLVYDPVLVKQSCRPGTTVSKFAESKLSEAFDQSSATPEERPLIRIPVCYDPEYAPDLETVARLKQLEPEELVRIHTEPVYRVYMIGFLPGFPYMATVPDSIAVPRKKMPAPVTAGSVGITGMQTGIYPLASPGGWQIIGRTPVQLFHPSVEDRPLLQAGDHVQFYRIFKEEFVSRNQYQGSVPL